MTNKQIIIDGVDVSGCPCIQSNNIGDVVCVRLARTSLYCKGQPCYYKALERKEQECKKLEETFDGLFKVQYKLADNNKKLCQCLTEIKEIAEIRKDDINDWLAKEILQKISECEDKND